MSPSPHDMDWLDEEERAETAEGESPEAVLRHIAAHGSSDQARVSAAKALMELGGGVYDTPLLAVATHIAELSGDELDNELAGLMDPGYVEPPEDRIQREVDHRVRKELKRRAKGLLDKVRGRDDEQPQVGAAEVLPALPPGRPAESVTASEEVTHTEEVTRTVRVARTIRLDTGEEIDTSRPLTRVEQSKLNRQIVRDDMRDRRRAALPPGHRQHVPPGLDPRDVSFGVGRSPGSG